MSNRTIEAKPVTCMRCGHPDCAWVQSRKPGGKYYLVEDGYVHPDLKADGLMVYSRFKFHKCKGIKL